MSTSGDNRYTVADFIDDVQAMLEALGPSDTALEQAGRLLRHLAERDDLHPETGYADLGDDLSDVVLHAEPDGSLALTLTRVPVTETPVVHGHGTWGVVCSYKGVALNVKFERQDDGTRDGYAEVSEVVRKRLERGDSVWWPGPPDAVHSVEGQEGRSAWVLALLGDGGAEGTLVFDVEQRRVWRTAGGPGCGDSPG